MRELVNKLLELKTSYNNQLVKARKLKTKAAQKKAFDVARLIRRDFSILSHDLDLNQFDMSKMNLMCPCAGPWCLTDASDFKHEGLYVSFKMPDGIRYVGEYSLIDNQCGLDNLAILANQLK